MLAMERQTLYNLICTGVIILFGTFITLSPWLAWTSYKVMNPAGLLKSFSLLPSNWADDPWLFYDLLPIVSWLPVLAGILIFVGLGLFWLEVSLYKTLFKFGCILAILMFGLFVAFILLFVMAEIFPIDLSFIGIPVTILADFTQPPALNEMGGWFLISSVIGIVVSAHFLKLTEYEEFLEEFKGLKEEEIKVHEKKIQKGTKKCPKCGARVSTEQLFCSQCGQYF